MRPASNRTLPVGSNTQRTWTTRSLMISSSYVKRLTYTHARSNNTPCARRARLRGLMVARSAHLSAWSAGVRRGRSEAAACERPGTSMWAGLGARWRGSRERRISRSGVLSRDRLEQSQGHLLITTDAAEGRGGLVYSYTITYRVHFRLRRVTAALNSHPPTRSARRSVHRRTTHRVLGAANQRFSRRRWQCGTTDRNRATRS